MKLFYQRSAIRWAKTDVIVELNLREIIALLLRREIRFDAPNDSVVLRYHGNKA
jgi:hypothetical protein